MKQVHVISTRYGDSPKGAYMSRANAEAACRAFGCGESSIVTVPLLDSDHTVAPESWPYEAMAKTMRKGGERDGV